MKAKVIKEFSGRPDNQPSARVIKVGEVVEGELAAVAMEQGWAKADAPEKSSVSRAMPAKRAKK